MPEERGDPKMSAFSPVCVPTSPPPPMSHALSSRHPSFESVTLELNWPRKELVGRKRRRTARLTPTKSSARVLPAVLGATVGSIRGQHRVVQDVSVPWRHPPPQIRSETASLNRRRGLVQWLLAARPPVPQTVGALTMTDWVLISLLENRLNGYPRF
jgi:hypothetical protein